MLAQTARGPTMTNKKIKLTGMSRTSG